MKIPIQPGSVNIDDLHQKLQSEFPEMKVTKRNKMMLVIAKSSTVGCNIFVRKNAVQIQAAFGSMGTQMVFTLALVLLGILIPLIIFFAAINPKQKAFEKEVVAVAKPLLGAG